jgi:hypothetical protein
VAYAIPGGDEESTMSHQPPKQNKKAPQHTAKEKKTLKQQKKHAGDTPASRARSQSASHRVSTPFSIAERWKRNCRPEGWPQS